MEDACAVLARALAAEGRYPAFTCVQVRVAEPKLMFVEMGFVREPTPEEKVAELQRAFGAFQTAGFEVGAEVRKTGISIM